MNWTIAISVVAVCAMAAVIVVKYLDMILREPGLCDNCQEQMDNES